MASMVAVGSLRIPSSTFTLQLSAASSEPKKPHNWGCEHPNMAWDIFSQRPAFAKKQSRNLQHTFSQPSRRITTTRCEQATGQAPESSPALVGGQPDVPPPGCSRVKLTLGKPLGMVLEEDKGGNIMVAEVVPDGNASKSGLIDVGDQLIAVSAVVYNTTEKYGEVEVRKGQEKVRLNVRGESFNTIMAAIGSHPAYIKVDLEIQKCEPVRPSNKNGL